MIKCISSLYDTVLENASRLDWSWEWMRSLKPIVLIVPNMSKDFSGIFLLYSPDTELKSFRLIRIATWKSRMQFHSGVDKTPKTEHSGTWKNKDNFHEKKNENKLGVPSGKANEANSYIFCGMCLFRSSQFFFFFS